VTVRLVGPVAPAPAEFEGLRSLLLGVARHIVGRAADAEDVVQDAWLRWQAADPAHVRSPAAFLVTVTRRLALNAATAAYARREVPAGDRMPDLGSCADDPVRAVERDASLAAAVQLLLERLSPAECAVYLLREAFGYSFREIAETLELSEANARQTGCRARQRVRQARHHRVDPAARERLLNTFRHAARAGETTRLVDLLRPPVWNT
jgi:RNA polymerase sigma-70 factor (ECF subfamily)